MRVSRTWDSIISLVPKGGETIWGNLDWSPEEDYECHSSKKRPLQSSKENNSNNSDSRVVFSVKEPTKYGRIVSFGKPASELPSSQLSTLVSKVVFHFILREIIGAQLYRSFFFVMNCQNEFLQEVSSSSISNVSCGEVWTEYDEMSRESIRRVPENKTYTATTILDLLRFVAPKMMQRAEAHYSHGIAEDLDDPKYDHYKYWSNPLETK